MKKTVRIVAQIIWVAICVLALIEARQGYRGASDWQMDEGLAFEMMVLSFPSSVLVAIGLASTGAILGLFGLVLPPSSRLEMTSTWFLFLGLVASSGSCWSQRIWRGEREVSNLSE